MTPKYPHAVFVHLGKSSASHLWLNLARHLKLFPQIPVTVILDHQGHVKCVPEGVEIYIFKRTDEYLAGSRFNAHDQKFRRGFWRYSLERLFAIEEFHQQLSISSSLLHIESDVLLLPNFPWEFFSELKFAHWNIYNNERDVSALLFTPGRDSTSYILRSIKAELEIDSAHTDMTILSTIRLKDQINFQILPSLTELLPSLSNPYSNDQLSKHFAIGGLDWSSKGVFDGAPIGMWLCGHDPRNNYGHANIHDPSPIINGDSIVDPSSVNYEMDDADNIYLSSTSFNAQVPLWSIHIHSKSLALFGKDWNSELRKYVELARDSEPIRIFRISAVMNMLQESIKGHTFLRFIWGIPAVHRARRILSPIKQRILRK